MTLLMRDQENIEKGKAEGKTEGKAELIGMMLKNGLTVEQIAEICGITKEEIKELMKLVNVTEYRCSL